ncbi:unnamed protein product [Zymoseptoria tritici ST99CH_1A5]|uniref:Uncharacterized protein n=3 Tax=Zymoseptoria tritici TaxID=1047171 RepID=A0A1X7RG45_ZYMT9|nr:unnamed protein product [Zymoseptoria tritici ST99CH_3D7]SMR42737.1 unnamed protein product [Zymoseptoria tritici ST99CH_1E4]SMR44909.1 unnamed protein product [Zymoseptoria tritici ST99CH_3D1]SMY20074.1 unnamed protein product [Zymoseptoria tritici ST99CH_1A5]
MKISIAAFVGLLALVAPLVTALKECQCKHVTDCWKCCYDRDGQNATDCSDLDHAGIGQCVCAPLPPRT